MATARERRLVHEFEEMRKLRRPGSLIDFLCADLTGEEASELLSWTVTLDSIKERLTGFLTPEAFEELYPGQAPEKYLVTFTCTGLMKEERTGDVVEHGMHGVEIVYGLDYPERPPTFVWLTPIWHPNIKYPNLCTAGRPFAVGTLLAQLCLMIGRMVQYHVYNVESPLNHEAADWARQNAQRFPVDRRSLIDGQVHERPDVGSLVQWVDEGEERGPLVELL